MDSHRSALITTLKKRQEMTEKLMERFQTNERINLIGNGIAHDLANMIEQIMISVSVLRTITPADDKQAQRLIAIIESGSTRAGEILKKLMTYSSGAPAKHQNVYIDHIVMDVVHALTGIFPKNIQIDTDISESLPPISGSDLDIYQAITNLCLNARDAMPEGGDLSISVKNVRLDKNDANPRTNSRHNTKAYICLRIADTGVGISSEYLSDIFKPYFSQKPCGSGTGLGLFNVRQIVEAHDGFITVESIPGSGTVFNIFFPVFKSSSI